ncbi:SurA N-terminal domain-containing protein [Ruminiclostridium herbifermentans]|uniref:SurA N-terminal domain-containing protein n=1 Tax=Ruminiclostridium herbifermentans TaxID=2488810 RepID=A0A4U7JL07_9FIRM|nr:SurA N-terminal domain-containing protein [Ruminiclostridium herbifermentans]QNU68419.1 SurA N-terminal domain-containing protein [Ruminiclostridium herbifermentans]
MRKLKTKRKVLVIFTIFAIATLACCIGYAVSNDSIANLFGKKHAEVLKNAGDDIVATVDGEKITKKGFDTYKLFLSNSKDDMSDQQILDKIIERNILYDLAIKESYSASDSELSSVIKTAQDVIKSDSQQYEAFKEYLIGLSMSEDEYWEIVIPAYEKAVTCGKYKKALKENFKKENKIVDEEELNTKFNDFYNQKVKNAKSKLKVETYFK